MATYEEIETILTNSIDKEIVKAANPRVIVWATNIIICLERDRLKVSKELINNLSSVIYYSGKARLAIEQCNTAVRENALFTYLASLHAYGAATIVAMATNKLKMLDSILVYELAYYPDKILFNALKHIEKYAYYDFD